MSKCVRRTPSRRDYAIVEPMPAPDAHRETAIRRKYGEKLARHERKQPDSGAQSPNALVLGLAAHKLWLEASRERQLNEELLADVKARLEVQARRQPPRGVARRGG